MSVEWIALLVPFALVLGMALGRVIPRKRAIGKINVTRKDEGVLYTLEFDDDPGMVLATEDEVLFEIHRESQTKQ